MTPPKGDPRFTAKALAETISVLGLADSQTATSYQLTCPNCQKRKLVVRKRDGAWKCWVCGDSESVKGARPEYILTRVSGTPLQTLREMLYGATAARPNRQRLGLHLQEPEGLDEAEALAETEIYPSASPKATGWPFWSYAIDAPESHEARRYLAKRGVSVETAVKYGLRWHPTELRVLVPCASQGRLLGWQGRFIFTPPGDLPKVLSTRGLADIGAIYFLDHVPLDASALILCEGPFDALKCVNIAPTIFFGGKTISPKQFGRLKKLIETLVARNGGLRVYIGLDPDAWAEIHRLRGLLGRIEGLDFYLLQPPGHRDDLGDCAEAEVATAYARAPILRGNTVLLYGGLQWPKR